jgi:NAD-dependent SIR2 family protein deacetylase
LGSEAKVEKIIVGMAFARSKTFTARPCSSCEALRQSGTNYTRVYATRGNVRYCRCHYCGNTWKDSDA